MLVLRMMWGVVLVILLALVMVIFLVLRVVLVLLMLQMLLRVLLFVIVMVLVPMELVGGVCHAPGAGCTNILGAGFQEQDEKCESPFPVARNLLSARCKVFGAMC